MIWEILFILVLILGERLVRGGGDRRSLRPAKGGWSSGPQKAAAMPRRALELARDPDRFLPTVQIGITLVSALGAAYGGQQIVDELSAMARRNCPGRLSAGMPKASRWRYSWRALPTLR